MANKTVFFDGIKSIAFEQYPDEAWTWLSGAPDNAVGDAKRYYHAIPTLFRGIQLIMDAVGAMPFAVYEGDSVIDESATYQNKVGFWPSPVMTLKQVVACLELVGMAYLYKLRKGKSVSGLKFFVASTVTPKLEEGQDPPLTGFVRDVGRGPQMLKVEDVVYFWLPDPYVEIGPPIAYPAKAALMACGVLANVDEFIASFFKRGAIKAMLLTVKGSPPPAEKEKLKTWWNNVVTGVRHAFGSQIIEADSVLPVVIGEGLEALQDQDLSGDKRREISVALGIPETKLFSGAASGLGGGGVSRQDDLRFMTDTIVPLCRFVEEILNVQLFEPLGYRLEFKPETLDVFKADENERAGAFATYVSAGMPASLTAEMLGIELPEGWEYSDLDPDPEPEKPTELPTNVTQTPTPAPGAETVTATPTTAAQAEAPVPGAEMRALDIERWQRKAITSFRKGKGAAVTFTSDYLDPGYILATTARLSECKSEQEVKAVFVLPPSPFAYAELVSALREAVAAVKSLPASTGS